MNVCEMAISVGLIFDTILMLHRMFDELLDLIMQKVSRFNNIFNLAWSVVNLLLEN